MKFIRFIVLLVIFRELFLLYLFYKVYQERINGTGTLS